MYAKTITLHIFEFDKHNRYKLACKESWGARLVLLCQHKSKINLHRRCIDDFVQNTCRESGNTPDRNLQDSGNGTHRQQLRRKQDTQKTKTTRESTGGIGLQLLSVNQKQWKTNNEFTPYALQQRCKTCKIMKPAFTFSDCRDTNSSLLRFCNILNKRNCFMVQFRDVHYGYFENKHGD